MTDNKEGSILKKEEKKFVPWEVEERIRPPWVAQTHGEIVLPQNEQKSNLHLSDAEVLQPRVQPVAISSQASPLNGRNGANAEQSGAKRTHPDSGGVAL